MTYAQVFFRPSYIPDHLIIHFKFIVSIYLNLLCRCSDTFFHTAADRYHLFGTVTHCTANALFGALGYIVGNINEIRNCIDEVRFGGFMAFLPGSIVEPC